MRKFLIAATLLLSMAGAADAQRRANPSEGRMPAGKWWKRPAVASRLQLTPAQKNQLDEIFSKAANDLIDSKAEVKKLEVALRAELDRSQVRRPETDRIVAELSAARTRLFDRELKMLVDMRAVLEEHQWTRLQQGESSWYTSPHLPRPRQR
jgi:Spy/CpxP family protein refolding chaperone